MSRARAFVGTAEEIVVEAEIDTLAVVREGLMIVRMIGTGLDVRGMVTQTAGTIRTRSCP